MAERIEQVYYRCTMCGRRYDDENKARSCEKAGKRNVRVYNIVKDNVGKVVRFFRDGDKNYYGCIIHKVVLNSLVCRGFGVDCADSSDTLSHNWFVTTSQEWEISSIENAVVHGWRPAFPHVLKDKDKTSWEQYVAAMRTLDPNDVLNEAVNAIKAKYSLW